MTGPPRPALSQLRCICAALQTTDDRRRRTPTTVTSRPLLHYMGDNSPAYITLGCPSRTTAHSVRWTTDTLVPTSSHNQLQKHRRWWHDDGGHVHTASHQVVSPTADFIEFNVVVIPTSHLHVLSWNLQISQKVLTGVRTVHFAAVVTYLQLIRDIVFIHVAGTGFSNLLSLSVQKRTFSFMWPSALIYVFGLRNLTHFYLLWGTLTLRVERQSARKSKTENSRLASLASNAWIKVQFFREHFAKMG